MGMYSYTAVVFIVTVRMLLLQHTHTWVNTLFCGGSIFMWFFYNIIYSRIDWNFYDAYFLLDQSWDHALYWLSIPVIVVVALLPDFVYDSYKRMFYPAIEDIAREYQATRQPTSGMASMTAGNDSGFLSYTDRDDE